jgi:hypothetical protein
MYSKFGCFMLLACLTGIAVLPEAQAIPLRKNLPRQVNPQRNLAPQNLLPRPVPSSPPLPRQLTPTSRPSIPVSSVKTTTIPIASKKVEQFAQRLRDDLNAQERVLHVFISNIRQRHQTLQLKMSRTNVILKGLKEQIANATQFENKYQAEENSEAKQGTILKTEYDKSLKMYNDEHANIKLEKTFLEEILKYIQLRKTQKC